MAKITRIGDKEHILEMKKKKNEQDNQLNWLMGKEKKELDQWCDTHFKDLPAAARDGLNTLVNTLWIFFQRKH